MNGSFKIILFARVGALRNEAQIISTVLNKGHSIEVVRTLPELVCLLEREKRGILILVVHLRSTLTESYDISGYDQFLRRYAMLRDRLRAWKEIRLIVITPPPDLSPNCFVGYGELVTAYLVESFTAEELLTAVEGIVAHFEERKPCGNILSDGGRT